MNPPSASVSVRLNGRIHPVPTELPGDVVFPIYSISKTLTAICVLRLVETGALSLTDAARRWLPDVDIAGTITLEMLLRHRSGLRDYGPLPEYHEGVRAHPDGPWSREQFLEAILRDGPLFAPGESFSYSNVGYMLLVDIAERVTGQSFALLIEEHVCRPLSLRRTFVLENVEDLLRCTPGFGSELSGHRDVVDVRGLYHPGWCAPRLVASTTEETSFVFDALTAGELLGADALRAMLTFVPLSDEPDENHGGGMGIYCDRESPWGPNLHHAGGGPGYLASATVYTNTRLGRVSIAVFVNASHGASAVAREDAVMRELLGET
jgi:D-alanyl-D-alanine carboxypeptidase